MDSRHPVRHARNLCTCMFLEFRADAMHHCVPVRLPDIDQPTWVHVNASVENQMCVRGMLPRASSVCAVVSAMCTGASRVLGALAGEKRTSHVHGRLAGVTRARALTHVNANVRACAANANANGCARQTRHPDAQRGGQHRRHRPRPHCWHEARRCHGHVDDEQHEHHRDGHSRCATSGHTRHVC